MGKGGRLLVTRGGASLLVWCGARLVTHDDVLKVTQSGALLMVLRYGAQPVTQDGAQLVAQNSQIASPTQRAQGRTC